MVNRLQTHPIIAFAKEIDKRGLMVFDDIRRMPSYGEPFVTSYMVISLNLQGWVRAECDMQPVSFHPHEIAVLPPHHVLSAHETSADYRAMLIVMSVDFQEERKKDSTDIYQDNFHYLHQPTVPLTDEQFRVVHQLFCMVRDVSLADSPNRREMLIHLLQLLFLYLQDYRRENGINEHQPSYHEQLFTRFYHAITQHYRESREVRFYADLFHLSPKHFATIIKSHTHINALDWINGYVVIQAKMRLRYQKQLTVQEIALNLGFQEQASFSRFFKANTGLTPTQYRENT